MEINAQNLTMLKDLLLQSLSPQLPIRQPAEANLAQAETQPGFLLLVITLVRDDTVEMNVRQSAGVYFKNVVKKRWSEESDLTTFDRQTIKSMLVPVMVALSTPSASRLQSQVGEAVSEIASVDFPEKWPNLLDDLVNSLSPDDFLVNNGVLSTAHSIFGRWRSQFRTNQLFETINLVLAKFCTPYFELFKRVDVLLSSPTLPGTTTLPLLASTLHLLLELFHDLNAQDLPEFFEDNQVYFMGDGSSGETGLGLLGKYLRWEREEIKGDDDDDVPGPLQKIKATICEIAELYAMKYADTFPQLGMFVTGVWEMLGRTGLGTRDDQLVSKALGFLSVVVKMGSHANLFADPATLQKFCDDLILPNIAIRTHEEEMFEDDPMEYIRQDLEPSTENDTRRAAATEFTRSLLQHFEQQITQIIGAHITRFLAEYNSNPAENWKSKDTAIFLLTSIASKGSTVHAGVTSTNALVNIVQFFSENVFADLQASTNSVHPILQVDAIKYLHTFRNQLTKDQLLSVLPLLVTHLEAPNYVIYSYAAITIERILFIKQDGKVLFNSIDVQPFANNILMACFRNIESGGTPEKIAENDYLMKCVMRVIITARQSITPVFPEILARLVAILGETSKNPSNPRFNQYTFESISALIRFAAPGNPEALAKFEAALFPPVEFMLGQDVVEFIPYAFQIISQLLELHPSTSLPETYQKLLAPLLHAGLWEQRGNVPALVRLWKALLLRGANYIVQNGQVQGLLGIFQRLITVKSTDVYAFDLLQSIYEFVPVATMKDYTRTVFMLCLQRLQSNKTTQVSQAFSVFALLLCALPSIGPDFFVEQLQVIQPGLAGQLLENVILPETQKISIKDRKIITLGLIRLITSSDSLLQPTTSSIWPQVLEAVLDIFVLPQDVRSSGSGGAGGDEGLDELDPEETSFQASFSKLGASEGAQRDPLAGVTDLKMELSKGLVRKSAERPGMLQPLMAQVNEKVAVAFAQYMQANGHQLS